MNQLLRHLAGLSDAAQQIYNALYLSITHISVAADADHNLPDPGRRVGHDADELRIRPQRFLYPVEGDSRGHGNEKFILS